MRKHIFNLSLQIITLQNKALRTVTESGFYQNVLRLSLKFNLLNLLNLHTFETAKIILYQINQHFFSNFNNYCILANFAHSRQTRTNASSFLIIPVYKTKTMQQS